MGKLLAILILILIIELETSGAPHCFLRRKVCVQNDLGDGIHLITHCKSKDDDLGVRDLANGQYTEWKFGLYIFGQTLFWCSMKWSNVHGKFDVYKNEKDFHRCYVCKYSIRQDEAYTYNEKDLGTVLCMEKVRCFV